MSLRGVVGPQLATRAMDVAHKGLMPQASERGKAGQ